MTITRKGMAGVFDILRKIENPEEFEPGMIPEIRRILTEIAQGVIALGRLANEIDAQRKQVKAFFDEGNMGLASAIAIDYEDTDRSALLRIAEEMRGSVEASPDSQHDDGYKVNEMEEE